MKTATVDDNRQLTCRSRAALEPNPEAPDFERELPFSAESSHSLKPSLITRLGGVMMITVEIAISYNHPTGYAVIL